MTSGEMTRTSTATSSAAVRSRNHTASTTLSATAVPVVPMLTPMSPSFPSSTVGHAGVQMTILWSSSQIPGGAAISLTLINPSLKMWVPTTIARATDAASGALIWTIPPSFFTGSVLDSANAVALSGFKIAYKLLLDGSTSVYSQPFTIEPAAPGVVTILTPTTATTYQLGDSVPVSLNYFGVYSPISVAIAGQGVPSTATLVPVDGGSGSRVVSLSVSANNIPATIFTLSAYVSVKVGDVEVGRSGSFQLLRRVATISSLQVVSQLSGSPIGAIDVDDNKLLITWAYAGIAPSTLVRIDLLNPLSNVTLRTWSVGVEPHSQILVVIPATVFAQLEAPELAACFRITSQQFEYASMRSVPFVMMPLAASFSVPNPPTGAIGQGQLVLTNYSIPGRRLTASLPTSVQVFLQNYALLTFSENLGLGLPLSGGLRWSPSGLAPVGGKAAQSFYLRFLAVAANGAQTNAYNTGAFSVTPPVGASIKITQPLAASVLYKGATLLISWQAQNIPQSSLNSTVLLIRADSPALGATLRFLGPLNGQISIPLSEGLAPGEYFVTVLINEYACIRASTGNVYIREAKPKVAVLFPVGGNTFLSGSTITIRWKLDNFTKLALESFEMLLINRASSERILIPSGAMRLSSGYINATLGPLSAASMTPAARSTFLVRLSPGQSDIPSCESGGFTISEFPAVALTSPLASFACTVGGGVDVSWTSSGLPDGVLNAELRNALNSTIIVVATGLASAGSIVLTLPSYLPTNGPAASMYFIRVTDSSTVFADTPAFRLLSDVARLSLNEPHDGSVVTLGQPLKVQWVSSGLTPNGSYFITLLNDALPAVQGALAQYPAVDATSSTLVDITRYLTLSSGSRNQWRAGITWVSADYSRNLTSVSGSFSVVASAALLVTTPSAGESFTLGSVLTIAWNALKFPGALRVSLFNFARNSDISLTAGIPAAVGNLSLTIDSRFQTSSLASSAWYARVNSESVSSASATAGPFSITVPGGNPYVVYQPQANQVYLSGTSLVVTFSRRADIAFSQEAVAADIVLRQLDSSYTCILATGTTLDSVSVQVPTTVPIQRGRMAQFVIQITASRDPSLESFSDAFTISSSEAFIRLTSPMSGTTVTRGEALHISWEASSSMAGAILLELHTSTGVTVSIASIACSGTTYAYTWVVPASVVVSAAQRGGFKVQVSWNADPRVTDTSAPFTISPPDRTLRLIWPLNQDRVFVGQSAVIEWQATNVGTTAANLAIDVLPVARLISSLNAVVNLPISGDTSTSNIALVATRSNATRQRVTCALEADVICGNANITFSSIPMQEGNPNDTLWYALRISDADDPSLSSLSPSFMLMELPVASFRVDRPVHARAGDTLVATWDPTGRSAEPAIVQLRCKSTTAAYITIANAGSLVMLNEGAATLALDMSIQPQAACHVFVSSQSGHSTAVSELFHVDGALSTLRLSAIQQEYDAGSLAHLSWNLIVNGQLVTASRVTATLFEQRRGGQALLQTFEADSEDVATSSTSIRIPPTAPLMACSILVRAEVLEASAEVVSSTSTFLVRPDTTPTISIVRPSRGDKVSTGGLLSVFYSVTGISASARVRITLHNSRNSTHAVLADGVEASGVFRQSVPFDAISSESEFTVEVALLDYAEIRGISEAFSISPSQTYLSVVSPTPGTVWIGGDTVTITWASQALQPELQQVEIALMQQNFWSSGGDQPLLVMAAQANIADGEFSWRVPGDLPSGIPVYVRVAAINGSTQQGNTKYSMWSRSANIQLKSAPLPGFDAFHQQLCFDLTAQGNLDRNPLISPWFNTDSRSLCLTSCSACTEAGDVWITGGQVSVDFEFAAWPGGQQDANIVKSMLGAFAAGGVNLCVPSSALDIKKGAITLSFDAPFVNSSARLLLGDSFGQVTSILRVSELQQQWFTCLVPAKVGIDFSVPVEFSGLEEEEKTTSIMHWRESIGTQLGVRSSDVSVTFSSDDAAATGSSRRLGAASSAAAVNILVADDDTAQIIADEAHGSSFSGPMGAYQVSSSLCTGFAFSAGSQLVAGASSAQPLYLQAYSQQDNRPLGGDDITVLSTTAFTDGSAAFLQETLESRTRSSPPTFLQDVLADVDIPAIVGGVVGGAIFVVLGILLAIYKRIRASAKVGLASIDDAAATGRNLVQVTADTVLRVSSDPENVVAAIGDNFK